jgi:hypothetical protein
MIGSLELFFTGGTSELSCNGGAIIGGGVISRDSGVGSGCGTGGGAAGAAQGGVVGTFIGGSGDADGVDPLAALLARRNASLIALMRRIVLRVHERLLRPNQS